MSQPKVVANELQGALGAQPAGDPILVFIGPSVGGNLAVNTPAGFGRSKDLLAAAGLGVTPQAACYYIQNYQKPVIVVRTAATTAASCDAVDSTGKTGTSVITSLAPTTANDDYDLCLLFTNGGTFGTTGITFQYSLDNGRTLSPVQSLGTAMTYAVPTAGGVGFSFAAGTIVTGDIVKMRSHAPAANSADYAAAIAALALSTYSWEMAVLTSPVDSTIFDGVVTAWGACPEKAFICSARVPNAAESEAAYKTALDAIFGAKATAFGMVCAGAALITSGSDYRQYRRPVSFAVGALAQAVSAEIDLAEIAGHNLPGVSIRDPNGNPLEHDESANPGLDDSRFCVLRTWDGEGGVYVNNPNLLSQAGSDFAFLQHRRVFNIFKRALRVYFQRRLSKPIQVNATTGFILESEAVEIESGASSILADLLLNTPKASGGAFGLRDFVRINRTDNLLSTKTMNVSAGLIPLAYPKTILIDEGFYNPALKTIQV